MLVYTDNLQYVRIGLVAALWAAVLGALGMTRYRRELTVEGAKSRDLQTVYQLQLEREVAARREYELGVEARVRRDMQVDADELAGLRAEVAALRKNLELLFDGELQIARPALRADSTRVQELPRGGRNGANRSPTAHMPRSGLDGHPPQPLFSGANNVNPAFAGPFDEPVTAETSAVPHPSATPAASVPTPATADRRPWTPEPEQWDSELGRWPESDQPEGDELVSELGPWPESGPEVTEPQQWSTEQRPWRPDAHWDDVPDESGAPFVVEGPRPGRRRSPQAADEADDGSHTTGLSVAQIMANLRSEGDEAPVAQRAVRRDYEH